jgi:hypothetical protein
MQQWTKQQDARQNAFDVSHNNAVGKVYSHDSSLFPYQPLSDDVITCHYAFVNELGTLFQDPQVLVFAHFSDETHFHLDGYINKQSFRFCVSENLRFTVANQMHPQRWSVMCWCLSQTATGRTSFHTGIPPDFNNTSHQQCSTSLSSDG